MSDLISRLDTVSNDATRAKSEIHNTLMEVWKVVDLLGRDQCGAVVEKVRVAQRSAEARVTSLQDENRQLLKDIENFKLTISKSEDTESSLVNEVKAERTRSDGLESEVRELRDKLHWASIMSNETKTYEIVSERIQNLLVVVSERTLLLNRITTMFTDAHQGFDSWQKEIQALSGLVRDSERDFISGYQGAAVDSLKRQVSDLETRLKHAEAAREDYKRQRDDARIKLAKQDEKQVRRSVSQVREAVTRRTSSGGVGHIDDRRYGSWVGWLTFGLISLGTGVVASTMISQWSSRSVSAAEQAALDLQQQQQQQQTFGFNSPARPGARTPPSAGGGSAPSMSPLTYVNPGSASRSPGSRNSTPRRY